ncbi:hypothetical protein FG475_19350 [Vibrio navarrensis]|nr:hypothetical protein [Vibrio navarrensis]
MFPDASCCLNSSRVIQLERLKRSGKLIWKKFNGLGLTGISMACGALALGISDPVTSLSQCVLFVVMLSVEYISNAYETSKFRSFIDEVLRNDKKLCFS